MGDLGNPHYNVAQESEDNDVGSSEPTTYDVEMTGKTGHTCHVYVMADCAHDANDVAQRQFPELELTGNTSESW